MFVNSRDIRTEMELGTARHRVNSFAPREAYTPLSLSIENKNRSRSGILTPSRRIDKRLFDYLFLHYFDNHGFMSFGEASGLESHHRLVSLVASQD